MTGPGDPTPDPTTAGPISSPGSGPPPEPPEPSGPAWADPPARRRRSTRRRVTLGGVLLVVVALVVTGAVVAHRGASRYYTYSPGSAPVLTADAACRLRSSGDTDLSLADGSPCARVTVPASRAHAVAGQVSMVDVLVGPTTSAQYIEDRLGLLETFHRGSQLIPLYEATGGAPADQINCQDTQEMTGATQDAAVAALTRLGYRVISHDQGAQLIEVVPGSGASAAGLRCNDVVIGLDGSPVTTADGFVADLSHHRPGDSVAVRVRRAGANGKPTTLTLEAKLGTPPPGSPKGTANRGFLGVATMSLTTYQLPFPVHIDVGDIGGPSAGLALTLEILDQLSDGHLTGDRHIAATGTISPDGTVGAIGGVTQKTVAVEQAGASVFFVPQANYADAAKEADSHLRVVAVSTLSQVLTDLAGLGGQVPLATPPTTPPA